MNSRTNKNRKIRKELRTKRKEERKEKRIKRKRVFLVIIVLLISFVLIYARYIEPSFLITNEIKIEASSIDNSFNGLKIVHFSDTHYGSTVLEQEMEKIVKEINSLKPDIVVFTGDLIEDDYKMSENDIQILTNYLSSIEAKLGKYAVIGNHDFYNKQFNDILFDSNFQLLNNEYDLIYNNNNAPIGIYGLDNITYGNPDINKYTEERFTNTSYKILILHEPDYIDNIIDDNYFDLVLAGHSHNQQINIPFVKGFWLPSYSKTYYKPEYVINGTKVFISNGIGTSGFKLRFNSVPSINFFRFYN